MILTRKNLKGGRAVTGFPIREESGQLGYFLGYCPGCNEQVMMAMEDRDILVATFHFQDKTLKKVKKLLKPKISLTESFLNWLVNWLNRQVNNQRVLVDNI